MAQQLRRVLIRDGPRISKQLMPGLSAAILNSRCGSPAEWLPTLQASASRWHYALFGSAGAAVAVSQCQAEPDSKMRVEPMDPYSRPSELKGLPKELILYQYEVCPFCCKVKAFLDYHKIPYRTVEVSPLTKKQLSWSEYRKVPVAVLDGEVIADSTAIITRLAAELQERHVGQDTPTRHPSNWRRLFGARSKTEEAVEAGSPVSAANEEKWRRWVDERLVRLLTVNIYRNMRESFQTFDYITESSCNFGFVEREAARVVGALMMWTISGRLKKKYNIKGDVRAELYKAANAWVDALGDHRYHGGEEPDLADLSVFGVIRSVTCTDTFMDLMHNSKIGAWYEHMMGAVGGTSRLSASQLLRLNLSVINSHSNS